MKNTHSKKRQSKLMRIVKLPIRALTSVKDLYVLGMTGCASRMTGAYDGDAVLRRSTSSATVSSSRSVGAEDDFGELIRASSVRSFGHKNEIDMLLHNQRMAHPPAGGTATTNGLPKSCSVGMGRIDEDKAYEFGGEDSVGKGVIHGGFGRRSRSVAVGRRDLF